MDDMQTEVKAVPVSQLGEDEKLPKSIIFRNITEEHDNGITDFKCALYRSYVYGRYTDIKITGEYSGKMSRYTLMMFLIYNGNGELIEASFDEEIDEDFRGIKTFSATVQVPNDEYISKVAVRFVPDPVFL